MGITATKGSFGICTQTLEGTAAATKTYIQATNVGLQPDQMAQPLPPEVGGKLWSSGAYKAGVSVLGDVSFSARANTIGWLLMAWAGLDTPTAHTGQSGMFDHVISEATDQNVPWVTLVKNVGDAWCDEYKDCKADTLRIDIPAAGIVSVTAGFVGKNVANMVIPTETFEYSPVFETCTGSVDIDGVTDMSLNRVSFELSNNLTRDERRIGSYFLDDITIIRKTCRVTMDVNIRNGTLYNQVYNNATTAWSPTIHEADVEITINTAKPVLSTYTGALTIHVPTLQYLTMPIPLAGQDIVRATLTAEVSVSTNEAFEMTLINGVASYAAS